MPGTSNVWGQPARTPQAWRRESDKKSDLKKLTKRTGKSCVAVCQCRLHVLNSRPDRTRPDKVRAHCRRRAKLHYTGPTGPDQTRADPHRSNGVSRRPGPQKSPCGSGRVRADPRGPARTRTDFLAARVSEKLRWVRAGLRQSSCESVRVRAGPVGSARARVVKFSYNQARSRKLNKEEAIPSPYPLHPCLSSFPYPFPPFPLPFLSLPYPFTSAFLSVPIPSSSPLLSLPLLFPLFRLEAGPFPRLRLEGLEERWSSPSGSGRSPPPNAFSHFGLSKTRLVTTDNMTSDEGIWQRQDGVFL